MSIDIAADDIVTTAREGAGNDREPLLVLEPLAAFLDAHGLGSGEIEVEPVGEGHSNVTYLLRRGDTEVILRRPPRGPLPPSAHDVLREARLLRALAPTEARVPTVLAVGDDASVIGAPFYVMERCIGEVVTTTIPPALDSPEQRRLMAEELVDALVEVHGVQWERCGLEGFGKPTGYLERQLRRFTGLWEHNRTREIGAVERVGAWLGEHLPGAQSCPPATIVHGDFRLGNTMFAAQAPARLKAIFDWEMATIGDPLADVGYMCVLWCEASDPEGGLFDLSRVTRAEGFPTRAELVARYEQRSGRNLANAQWYMVLALWKSIVFMEGNYKRAISGTTDDPFLHSFGEGVLELARRAEAMTGEAGRLL